jgi:hypothetical protein
VHREIDPLPVESLARTPLPSEALEAGFAMNTGGDQMSTRPVDAGLALHVAFGTHVFRQQFASCRDCGHGDALSDGTDAIDWAECDGTTYSLHVSNRHVEVRDENSHAVVTVVPVPPGLHHVPR